MPAESNDASMPSGPAAAVALHGRWLGAARAAWVLVLVLGLGLLALSLAQQFSQATATCSGGDACAFPQLTSRQAQELRQLGLSYTALGDYFITLSLLQALLFVMVGTVIFWRKSDDRLALYAAFTLVMFGIANAVNFPGEIDPRLQAAVSLYQALGYASLALFFFVFPDGRFVPRWTRWLALPVVAREVLARFVTNPIVDGLFLVMAPLVILLQVYRYRRVSNAVQRHQTKWVVYGLLLGLGSFVALMLFVQLAVSKPDSLSLAATIAIGTGLSLSLVLIPLSLGLAILRSRLWDIDLLIRRTLVYAALTGLLGLAYFGSVLVLQGLVRLLPGQSQSPVVTVVSTLAIAALFVPLRRRVQAFIDRRFYRRKYDAARALQRFSASMRDEVDLDELSQQLLNVVDETMQPEQVSLWMEERTDQ